MLCCILHFASAIPNVVKHAEVTRHAANPLLRGANSSEANGPHGSLAHLTAAQKKAAMPCQCEASSGRWVKTARTVPKCIFIDLGAADGNSFREFLGNKYGSLEDCPSGQWEAVLVEANPRFDAALRNVVDQHHGMVRANTASAAYMCEARTVFYLDTHNHEHNYWGSSMSDKHPDAQESGLTRVEVPTVNLNRLLYEQTIPADRVMVKMDIEGSEWDVLPCLADAPPASLLDVLYLEEHPQGWGLAGTTAAEMEAAKAKLRRRGVDIPYYFSQTL